jgi:hypothetical protein
MSSGTLDDFFFKAINMPIEFDQPGPLNAGISAGYGATEQFNQTLPTLMSGAERAAALMLQARAQGNAGLAQKAALDAQANAQQQAQVQDSSLGVAQLNAQTANAMNQQQLQATMFQQDLTQPEILRMNRLNQALATVNTQVQSGIITPDEGRMMTTQIQTGLDPYKQRLEAQQLRQEQMQTQQMMHAAAQQESIEGLNNQFAAGNIDKLPLIQDPISGKSFRMLRNRTGEWYDPFAKSRPDEKTEKPEKVELEADFINKASKAAEAHADANYPDEAARMGRTKDERGNPVTPQHSEEWVRAFQDKYNGLTADYNARRSGKEGRHVGPVDAPTVPGTPAAKQAEVRYDQRKQLDIAHAAAQRVFQSDLPLEVKARTTFAIKEAHDILDKVKGDPSKLTDAERARLLRLGEQVNSVTGALNQPPPAPSPAPAPRFEQNPFGGVPLY